MEKLGVERRTYTAGEHKAFLDPFSPEKPEERAFWQGVLNTTHQQFIAMVKQGRGERLKDKEHPELFSGLVWSGEQAKALGLVDGLGSASYVAREIVGEKDLVDYTVQESPFDRFSKRIGASVAEHLAMWMGFQGRSCADSRLSGLRSGPWCLKVLPRLPGSAYPPAESVAARSGWWHRTRGCFETNSPQTFRLEAPRAIQRLLRLHIALHPLPIQLAHNDRERHAVDLAVPGCGIEQRQPGQEGHLLAAGFEQLLAGAIKGVRLAEDLLAQYRDLVGADDQVPRMAAGQRFGLCLARRFTSSTAGSSARRRSSRSGLAQVKGRRRRASSSRR